MQMQMQTFYLPLAECSVQPTCAHPCRMSPCGLGCSRARHLDSPGALGHTLVFVYEVPVNRRRDMSFPRATGLAGAGRAGSREPGCGRVLS